MGPYPLIFAALVSAAVAQETGSAEGRVTSSAGHAGIAGITVSVGTQRIATDGDGAFRVNGLGPGEHRVTFEGTGFFPQEKRVRVESGVRSARLDVELVAHSSLAGRVVDEAGRALAGIRVEITQAVRGTGTTWYLWRTITDQEGRYREEKMEPGAYLVMVQPNATVKEQDGERRAAVRTYYPGVRERSAAGRIVLRGGTDAAADIRIVTQPVFAIRGRVSDGSGAAANATVTLVPAEAMEEAQAQVKTKDGVFELRDVPPGDWRLLAEADGAGKRLRGATRVLLNRHDVDNVGVRASAPFALSGVLEPGGTGSTPSIELYPADAPSSLAAFSRASESGTLSFPAIYPGRYRVNVFGAIPGYYLDSVRIGEQDVLGKETLFAEGMPPMQVVYRRNTGGLRGRVEKCGGAVVLVFPEDEGLWDSRFIRQGKCDGTGQFEMGGLRPGSYYVLALERIDGTGLDDLTTLRRLAGMGAKAVLDADRTTYVELSVMAWPE